MKDQVYQVKLVGFKRKDWRFISPTDPLDEFTLAEETFGSLAAAIRFVGWFFNVDPDKVLGLNEQGMLEHLHPHCGSYHRSTWSGFDGTGLESLPATAIRAACPPLADFYGFLAEFNRLEVLPADWQPVGKHWND